VKAQRTDDILRMVAEPGTGSVFAGARYEVFTPWHVRLRTRSRLMGGIPKDPKVIEGWLRKAAGIEPESELKAAVIRTVREIDEATRGDMSDEEVMRVATEEVAREKETTGFKKDANGLYLEGRQIKSMIKEVTNILYAGDRWGPTRKGPRSYLAERVFPEQERIYFGKDQPDGTEMFIGHVSGPKGPQSTLGYHEYVENQVLEFDLLVCEDAIEYEAWPRLWVLAQENGLGALRSQGFGTFDVEEWTRMGKSTAKVRAA
jgi:hypothetical protein